MKVTKIFISVLFITILAVPAMASSDWVDDFLKRLDLSKYPVAGGTGAGNSTTPNPQLGQILRTGELPVTMSDVVSMMLENNLDIRSDRLIPRTAYYQSLVFYRALLPSFRLNANIARDTAPSSTQLNGATSLTRDTGLFDASVSQSLATGTSFTVDLSMARLLTNSNNSIYN